MLSALAGFSSLNAMLRIGEIKMQKILVEKDIDDKNAVRLKISKGSAFYDFLMEGEFENADRNLYREVMGIREGIEMLGCPE